MTTLDRFEFRKWNHYAHIMAPMAEPRHQVFMTSGSPIQPHLQPLIYSVAERCPQHHFAINVNSIDRLYGVPDNVLPVFCMSNVKLHNFYEWLDRGTHDPFKPKVVSLWCESYDVPSRLEEVDWILLNGLKYKSISKCFARLLNINPNIYVAKYRNSTRIENIPQNLQYRVVPKVVRNYFEDRLW